VFVAREYTSVVKILQLRKKYAYIVLNRKGDIVSVHDRRDDARRAARRTNVVMLVDAHETRDSIQCSEFFNELFINAAITEHLLRRHVCPHFVEMFQGSVLKGKNQGFFEFQRGDTTLEKLMCRVGLRETKSLFFQVLVGLHVAQHRLELKHHDCHSDNVMVRHLGSSYGLRRHTVGGVAWTNADGVVCDNLGALSHFVYILDGVVYRVPNVGSLALISDFGMSAITDPDTRKRIHRVDYALFEDSDTIQKDDESWGAWNCELNGQHGYDLQVLFASAIHNTTRLRRNVRTWLEHSLARVEGKRAKTSKHSRPVVGKVSDMSPVDCIRSIFSEFETDALRDGDFVLTRFDS